ncbi:type VII secretion-associated serine protease mycosin [Streptosporangium becharense]|uniref:Type VII secretion-associated serine protease mycosin n=1 Tax=Streptosporangium becharense TaxID=1816182 RepID=A0A7W9MI42_9ACTN|nr:S8 family serine peptidase [Streptosporangium becharense]MBB2913541.1 type VII secretion-associated serine protease mycosin [Streptosporangium becharense]MBB5821231.1 type VII secretion-associated serine protease mycosin [Streptosporangium becharense]
MLRRPAAASRSRPRGVGGRGAGRREVGRIVCAVVAAALTPLVSPAAPAALADDVRGGQREVLRTLDLPAAWRVSRGSGVTVAVLDSGVDPAHRDLVGSVVEGRDFTVGANPPGVRPMRLHGTYMASLIAAHGHGYGGADGVIGVAPEARILSVRVILEDKEPGFRTFNTAERYENVVARGIRYAVDHGADVINMSISKELATGQERAAIRYAISKGVVLVAAAGNEGAGRPDASGHAPYSYPAAFPGVVSVAAADRGLRRAAFSNRNPSVLLAAPGVDIFGAGPGDKYWVGRGTSQATALVSGVAALIKAKYPKMSPPLVAQALVAGAIRRPAGGYDTGTGFGVVNARRALAEAARLSRHTLTADGTGGHDPARPLGRPAEPVRVIHRDRDRITAYAGVAAVSGFGAVASLAVAAAAVGRARSPRAGASARRVTP